MSETIQKKCLYHRMVLPYTVGLGTIYTEERIKEAMRSPSFPREYLCVYGYGTGNVFTAEQLDEIMQAGQQDYPRSDEGIYMGVDPGYGSSKFAIVVTEWLKEAGQIHVIHSEEIERAEPESAKRLVFELYKRYHCMRVLVDASGAGFIKSLKLAIGENPDYLEQIKRNKSMKIDPFAGMKVLPIPFSGTGKEMLDHLRSIADSKRIAINKSHDKLLMQLRIAHSDVSGDLDKEGTNTMDLLDALRLACWRYGSKK